MIKLFDGFQLVNIKRRGDEIEIFYGKFQGQNRKVYELVSFFLRF